VSREDYVAIASRLFAIFLFVMVARSFPSAIALIGQKGPQPSLWLVVFVLASGIAICVALWIFPLTIARKLLPVMKEPRSDSQLSESAALSVGLTLLGVWVFATALPDLIYWGTLFHLSRQVEYGEFQWRAEQIASVTTTVAELALALWLVFGSSGIRRLIYKFRYGGS